MTIIRRVVFAFGWVASSGRVRRRLRGMMIPCLRRIQVKARAGRRADSLVVGVPGSVPAASNNPVRAVVASALEALRFAFPMAASRPRWSLCPMAAP